MSSFCQSASLSCLFGKCTTPRCIEMRKCGFAIPISETCGGVSKKAFTTETIGVFYEITRWAVLLVVAEGATFGGSDIRKRSAAATSGNVRRQ